MRRAVLAVTAVFAAIGIGATAARADQTPVGNLGKPETYLGGGAFGPLVVPTASCPDFATSDMVAFAQTEWGAIVPGKRWFVGPPSDLFWVQELWIISGSTSGSGFSYKVRANLERDGFEFAGSSFDEFLGTGPLTITRSDGVRMQGDVSVVVARELGAWVAYWVGTPTCA